VERLAFSVIWEMTPGGDVVGRRFTKSVIASRAALTYQQAQERIDNADMQDDITQGEGPLGDGERGRAEGEGCTPACPCWLPSPLAEGRDGGEGGVGGIGRRGQSMNQVLTEALDAHAVRPSQPDLESQLCS
jgi:hypothetical protein